MVYLPVNGFNDKESVVKFIKNDHFKFIVGVIFFDIMSPDTSSYTGFNKASAYGLSMGLLGVNDSAYQEQDQESGNYEGEGGYNPGYGDDDDNSYSNSSSSTYTADNTVTPSSGGTATVTSGTINLHQTHTITGSDLIVDDGSVSDDTLIIR